MSVYLPRRDAKWRSKVHGCSIIELWLPHAKGSAVPGDIRDWAVDEHGQCEARSLHRTFIYLWMSADLGCLAAWLLGLFLSPAANGKKGLGVGRSQQPKEDECGFMPANAGHAIGYIRQLLPNWAFSLTPASLGISF